MKILVTETGKVVTIGSICELGFWEDEPDVEKWKVEEGYYAIDNGYTAYDIGTEELPERTMMGKYLYQDNAFVENPNWVEPPLTLEEQVAQLQETINALLGEE